MEITKKVQEACKLLDELDDFNDAIPTLMSDTDMAISDLYHYIENNKMNTKNSYRVVKELKNKLGIRREIKEARELLKTYNVNKSKIVQSDNRQLLIGEMYKMEKQLTAPYKNRVYDAEELKSILED